MPVLYSKEIDRSTKLAVWQIKEPEDFFISKVPLKRDITHPNKRLQHLAGRFLLPFLFPDFPYEEIEIADTRKPFLPNEQYHFSISHCGAYAAAIVSKNCRVGIDVEFMTPRVEKIKRKFLHIEELAFVEAQSPETQIRFLNVLWSAKEAMYKWYGAGLVDFSEMMRVDPFDLALQGEMSSVFSKGQFSRELVLNYLLLQELTLVWVASE